MYLSQGFQYLDVNSKHAMRLTNLKGCTYIENFCEMLLLYFEASIFSSVNYL